METTLVILIMFSFQIGLAQQTSEKKYGHLAIANKKTDRVKKIGQGVRVKCWDADDVASKGELILLSDSTLMVDGELFFIDSMSRIRSAKRKVNTFGVLGIGTGICLMSAGAFATLIEIIYGFLGSNNSPVVGPVIFFSGSALFTAGALKLLVKKRFHTSKNEFGIFIRPSKI